MGSFLSVTADNLIYPSLPNHLASKSASHMRSHVANKKPEHQILCEAKIVSWHRIHIHIYVVYDSTYPLF